MFFFWAQCGIYIASLCLFDPKLYDQPRTKEGCYAASVHHGEWNVKCVDLSSRSKR